MIPWRYRKRSFEQLSRLGKATQRGMSKRRFHYNTVVTRVELYRALKISYCLTPPALTTINRGGVPVKFRIVRQCPACEIQLCTCAVVISKAMVRIIGARSVNFASIWLKPGGIPESCVSQLASGRGVIKPYPVNVEVNGAE